MKNNVIEQIKIIAFKGWNGMRWLRLGLGILILIQGIKNHDWIMNIIAVSLILQAIFNAACCSTGGCYTNTKQTNELNTDIQFEEIQKK